VRTDRIDFAVYPMPWLSGKVKAANIGIVPGLVNSPEEGLEWRNRKVWDLLSAEVEKAGVEMISLLWSPATYAGRVAVPRTPDGVEGLKMRGMGRPLEKILAANGAAITSMPAADTYMAMQTGALDVMFSTISSFTGYSMHEVVKEIVTGPSVIYGAHFVLMSPKTEGKLTGEQFQALNEAMIEGEKIYTRLAAEEADRMAEDFSAKGVKVVTLTQEEFDAWIAEAKKHAWTDFVESTPNGQELIDAIDQPR
jgi:TRAP-type C4-dicarboxylate transport system substrate-binding protein